MSRDNWPDTVNVSRHDLMRRQATADDLNRRYEWARGRRDRQRRWFVVLAILAAVGFYVLQVGL